MRKLQAYLEENNFVISRDTFPVHSIATGQKTKHKIPNVEKVNIQTNIVV